MRAAQKVMYPILLCWLMTSESDAGGVAVDVETSHQYSITCCCHVTDDIHVVCNEAEQYTIIIQLSKTLLFLVNVEKQLKAGHFTFKLFLNIASYRSSTFYFNQSSEVYLNKYNNHVLYLYDELLVYCPSFSQHKDLDLSSCGENDL